MSDNTVTPTDSGESNTNDVAGGEPTETVETLKAKLAEVTQERNKAAQVARKRQEIIDAFQTDPSSNDEDETPQPKGKGAEAKKLDAAKAEIAKLNDQLGKQGTMLNEKLLKDEVFREAEKVLTSDPVAREQWWQLNKDRFALNEEGKAEVKDDFATVGSFLKESIKDSPWFSFTSKAGGSGVPTKGRPVDATGKLTVETLHTMPREDRVKAMAKDPALRAAYSKFIESR